MLVENIIERDIYDKLIEYAFKKCDAVMFVARKDGFSEELKEKLDKNITEMKTSLKNDFLKKRNGSYWVFTKVGYKQLGINNCSDPIGFDELFEIMFYKTSNNVKDYLLKNENLYDWLNPDFPEDISFFSNGYCWLYSIAHENLCYIYCDSKEEYDYLKSIGIEFANSEFIYTPKQDLYYENYN